MEIDDAAGIRQIVRHEHDAAYRQRCVVPHLRKLVVGTAADDRQRRQGMVASFSTAPSAAGANMSTCWVWISSGAATVAP